MTEVDERLQEFALKAGRSLFLSENRGDLLEVINKMLEVVGLPHETAPPDEEGLAQLLDIDDEIEPKPTIWDMPS